MGKLQQKSTEKKVKSETTVSSNNKAIIYGSFIATFIAITPYLFYLYESVPQTQIWDTFLFTFDAKSWEDSNYLMWVFVGKIIPLLLIFIWFFTCKHWWYHALIVPISMYVYQIFGLFNDNLPYYDEFDLIHLLPVMAIIIPSIYLVRAKMFNKIIEQNQTLEDLEEEFKLKPKTIIQKLGDYF